MLGTTEFRTHRHPEGTPSPVNPHLGSTSCFIASFVDNSITQNIHHKNGTFVFLAVCLDLSQGIPNDSILQNVFQRSRKHAEIVGNTLWRMQS
ncbi:MAG: hypothetical protein ACYSWW_26995, partial [Planctomycetota bacterium]